MFQEKMLLMTFLLTFFGWEGGSQFNWWQTTSQSKQEPNMIRSKRIPRHCRNFWAVYLSFLWFFRIWNLYFYFFLQVHRQKIIKRHLPPIILTTTSSGASGTTSFSIVNLRHPTSPTRPTPNYHIPPTVEQLTHSL